MPGSVLVVDDDPTFRRLAERLLRASDLDVAGIAGTAAEAISAAHAVRPDGALIDVDLPDGNGVALAAELGRLPWQPKVVLTSVDPHAVHEDDVRRCGASAFVGKAELPNAPLDRLLATA